MKNRLQGPIGSHTAANSETFEVIRCYKGRAVNRPHDLITEAPLVVRIDGQIHATVMRTPGEEIFHAAGFCLSEGIVDDLNEFAFIGFSRDMDADAVEIRLTPERHKKAEKILEQKELLSLSSCGICRRELKRDVLGALTQASGDIRIRLDDAVSKIEALADIQEMHKKTRGSHAAMILDSGLNTLSISEDVGRHNAMDKAIGRVFMAGKITDARICVLSSRISYEMVIKANRACMPIILSGSRPTALAVRLGKSLGMTLSCAARKSELIIFTGEERIEI